MNTRDHHRHRNLNRGSSSNKRAGQISRTATVHSTEYTQLQDTSTIRNALRKSATDAPSTRSRHDSFPLPPSTSLNPHPLKRKKSSLSTSMHTDDNRPNADEPIGLRDSSTSYYSLPSSRQSYSDIHHPANGGEHTHHESDVPSASNSKRDRDKGKAVDRAHASHSGSSRRDRDASADDTRRSKHQERPDKHMYFGPLAHAEFERMKCEIDNLKKIAQDHKRTAKRHVKKVEEMKSQLLSETQAKEKHEAQVQALKTKYDKHEELITTIEASLQCQICMDPLHKPFALSPCGHILCLLCLQQWFRQAPPSADDMEVDLAADAQYILSRPKSCPCCRAVVRRRPVPVFLVKAVVGAVAKARAGTGVGSPGGSRELGVNSLDEEDPWKGIFANDEDDEEFESSDDYDEDDEDDEDEDEDSDDDDEDSTTWALHVEAGGMPGPFRLESEASTSGSGTDDDDDDDDDDGAGEEDTSEHPITYVPSRWEPPTIAIDASEREYDPLESPNNDESLLTMQRRGCPLAMIENFGMVYFHDQGLIAHLDSLDERHDPTYTSPVSRVLNTNRVFLGWNIRVDEERDADGRKYMRGVLREVRIHPRRWGVRRRTGEFGRSVFDMKRLVRVEELEEWDTTDTEAWVQAGEGGISGVEGDVE